MIAAVNEKYGTSFTSYTPVEIHGLDVGDDWPDWDAYEKILLPSKQYFAIFSEDNAAYITGFIQGNNAFINTDDSNACWLVSDEGEISTTGGPVSNYSLQTREKLLEEYGKEFDEIGAFVEDWEQGGTVPNWENYNIL